MLSLRRRLALAHLGAVVVIVSVAAATGWWQLSRAVHGQLDAALLALAETETSMLAENSGPVRVHDSAPGIAQPSLARLDRLVQIVDSEGNVLARSNNSGAATLPAPPSLLRGLADGGAVFVTLPDAREEPLRMVTVPARAGARRLAVQVAGSLDDVNQLMRSAALLFAVLAATLLAAVGYAGAMLTRGAFDAIDNIVDQARRIGEANLAERLPDPGTDDEIGHLAATLNAMLGRLEGAFDTQRRFTADASHELRSPLSRLRTEIEVTLRRPRASSEYVDTLRSCLDEVQRMTTLVEDLLSLARLDVGAHAWAEGHDAVTLARECIARIEPSALEKRVTVDLLGEELPSAQIGRAPAALVLSNLIDNAVKFSPTGGRVTVSIARTGSAVTMTVADEGPGIDPGELPFLFDRFYRGAGARASTPGAGLGLALSQAVAQAHGGRIDVAGGASMGPGARFTATFPLATPARHDSTPHQ